MLKDRLNGFDEAKIMIFMVCVFSSFLLNNDIHDVLLSNNEPQVSVNFNYMVVLPSLGITGSTVWLTAC